MPRVFWVFLGVVPALFGCRVDTTLNDNTPPVVTITSPTNGATVSGTVSVNADVSDDSGVARVRFLVDGTVASTVYAWPFHFDWNTVGLAANSSHTIKVEAIDESQNQGTAEITVTVQNGTNIR